MKHFLFPIVKLIIHKLHKKKRVEEEDNNCKIIQLVRCTFTLVNLYLTLYQSLVSLRHYNEQASTCTFLKHSCGDCVRRRSFQTGRIQVAIQNWPKRKAMLESLTPRVRPLRLTWKTDNCWKLLNICTLIIEYLLFSLTMNDSSKTCFQRCEVLLKFQLALFNAFR